MDVVFSALSHGDHDASGSDPTHRQTLYEQRWTPESLLVDYPEPKAAGDPVLGMVERDRVRVLPVVLRGAGSARDITR